MKKYILILTLSLSLVLCGCDAQTLEKADSLYADQMYSEALELYKELPESEEIKTKITDCNNALNLKKADEHYAKQEYAEALILYELLPISDEIQVKIEECSMHENADYEFLAAIEASILERNSRANAAKIDRNKLVNIELAYLERFESRSFYDSDLRSIYDKYLSGLYTQKEALDEPLYCDHQIKWQVGAVERLEALNELYLKYNFLSDNANFIGTYISGYESEKNYLTAIQAIEADLDTQVSPDGEEWYMPNEYAIERSFKNNTKFEYSTVFEMYFYDENDILLYSSTTLVENIKPETGYIVSLYVPYDCYFSRFEWNNWYSEIKS